MDLTDKQIAWMDAQIDDLGVTDYDLLACYAKTRERRLHMAQAAQHVLDERGTEYVIASCPTSIKITLLTPQAMRAAGWTWNGPQHSDGAIQSRRYNNSELGLLRVSACPHDLVQIGARDGDDGCRLAKGLRDAYRHWDLPIATISTPRDMAPEQLPPDVMADYDWHRADA